MFSVGSNFFMRIINNAFPQIAFVTRYMRVVSKVVCKRSEGSHKLAGSFFIYSFHWSKKNYFASHLFRLEEEAKALTPFLLTSTRSIKLRDENKILKAIKQHWKRKKRQSWWRQWENETAVCPRRFFSFRRKTGKALASKKVWKTRRRRRKLFAALFLLSDFRVVVHWGGICAFSNGSK